MCIRDSHCALVHIQHGRSFFHRVIDPVVNVEGVQIFGTVSYTHLDVYKRQYEDSVPEYSYRVYCWVRGGDEPAELDRLVRNAAANVTDSRVYSSEDTGLIWPVGDSMAKVLTLNDQAFEEWYGTPLPAAEEGTLSCVYASDGQQEPSFNIGQTAQSGDCVVTDFCSNPLPAGLQEENGFSTQYLITTQSAYDAFPGKLQRAECLLQILVETQDAAQLTPAVTQALAERAVQDDGHDLVGSDVTAYVIQDFTRSSRNYAATEAAIDLLRICCGGFAVLLAVGCTASILSAVSAQAQMRRREFALLRSAGMTQAGIRRTPVSYTHLDFWKYIPAALQCGRHLGSRPLCFG